MYKTLLIIFIQIIDKILETRKLFISKGVESSNVRLFPRLKRWLHKKWSDMIFNEVLRTRIRPVGKNMDPEEFRRMLLEN